MPITRTIYTQGVVTVDGNELFAQSVNWNHNMPKESLTALGRTSFQRVPSGPETATLEVTFYPTGGEGGLLSTLTADSLAVAPTRSTVACNVGGLTNALLSSVKGDVAVGSIPTITASFIGTYAAAAADASPSSAAITTIQTTEAVTINGSGCAQRASFSWDVPIEPISCLGRVITTGAEFFGNPPGSASINAEGTTAPETVTQIDIGNFTFNLGVGASLSSRSNNLAVGQMHGTFNSVTDGLAVNATFADS